MTDAAHSPDLATVKRRIAETIAWCRPRLAEPTDDPLRTPALRPANKDIESDSWGYLYYGWGTTQDRRPAIAAVDALADTRAELLRQAGTYTDVLPPNLAGGRLVVFDPEESDSSGLSEAETRGFVDASDVPAWDTWVCYVQEPWAEDARKTAGTLQTASYLLYWVPPELIHAVSEGILVNPTECFFWAAEYRKRGFDTELLRRLDAEGLLR